MAALNVFLATAGPAQGIRDVLTDLSAASLVEPFIWIDQDSIANGADRVAGAEVAAGNTRQVLLQAVLAGSSFAKVRLCVLVPFLDSAPAPRVESERIVADILTSNAGISKLVRLRLLLARAGGEADEAAMPALAGWHNLLLAPEDSRGPRMGHESLVAPADAVSIGQHAAPMVAGIMGLWKNADHAPFDNEQALPGNAIRVVRSYYRRLDTAQAEDQLHRRVLDSSGPLPLPRDVGESVIYIDDAYQANQVMANALWTKHKDVLKGARVPYPEPVLSSAIGLGAALRMFFSFLGAALRNAPMAWYARITGKLSSAVASTVHKTVFGSAPSAYTVVVNGVSADGRRVTWLDYARASNQMSSALGEHGAEPHAQRTDLSAVWRDYAAGALTLADAGERSEGLPPFKIGSNRAVLQNAAEAVPGPRDVFTGIPGVIGTRMEVSALEPADVMGIHEARGRLQELEQDQGIGLDARRTSSAVGGWLQRVRRSYSYVFGEILSRELYGSLDDVRALLSRLEAAGRAEDPGEEARKRQRALAIWSQVISVLVIVAIIAGSVCAAKDWIPWLWWGVAIIVGAVLVWIVSLSILFLRGQQALFQLINRKRHDEQVVEIDRANLRTALRDVDRLAAAYGQHLSWSRSLGAFLEQPLGQPSTRGHAHRRIDWGLPRNAAVGYASPDGQEIGAIASFLRQDLFRVGWLTGLWESLVQDSGAQLGPVGEVVRQNPALMWSLPGDKTGSALDEWSQRLRSGQITATGGEVLWARALGDLAGPKRDLAQMLTRRIEFRIDDSQRQDSLQEFVAGVGQQLAPGEGGHFDRAVFSDVASTRGAANVDWTVATTTSDGLGLIAVSTQCTAGLTAEDLCLTRTSAESLGDVAPKWAYNTGEAGRTQDAGHAAPSEPIDIHQAPGLEF